MFEEWIAKDQALMTLINVTLSPAALAYVVGSTTSKEIWDVLEKHYLSNCRTNVVNLKTDLQSIVKKPGESISDYVKRIKELKNKLANVSVVINDEDLLIYALNGLPAEYNAFRTSIYTRPQAISFEEFHVLLLSKESAINKQDKREDILPQPSAMLASQISQQRNIFLENPLLLNIKVIEVVFNILIMVDFCQEIKVEAVFQIRCSLLHSLLHLTIVLFVKYATVRGTLL